MARSGRYTPIIAFDVQRNGQWVSLDTGKAVDDSTVGASAPPTEDPSLPVVSDPIQSGTAPTPTPVPAAPHSGGQGTSSGSVQITDIFYNGNINPSEPDEYVEISNKGSDPVYMGGWTLRDVYGAQQFTWNNFTLQSGQSIRVYTNQVHTDTGGFSFGSRDAIWSNKGDAAELVDGSGNVVSTFSYGNKQ